MNVSNAVRTVASLLTLSLAQTIVLAEATTAPALTPVSVQDFERACLWPKVWVVNLPSETATGQLSTEHPFAGKQCYKLHYSFTGPKQSMGADFPARILTPIHKVHFQVFGDGSGSGYGINVIDRAGWIHSYHTDSMKMDFKGWKEIVVDLNAPHTSTGTKKDPRVVKDGKIEYPITRISFEVNSAGSAIESDVYLDNLVVDSEDNAQATLGSQVAVAAPAYGADIKGDTTINIAARGFTSVTAKCWMQGEGFGSDSTVATVPLDAKGNGSFVFPADRYPHGPITVRIAGDNGKSKDRCYLQLYNKGGVSWNEGLPETPPAAVGMKLIFADDFSGPPSISSTDPKATYYDHKPYKGLTDFGTLKFAGYESARNPFAQMDTYLRIRADEKTQSAGLLSSMKNDGTGIKVYAPCYFECRFIGPSAMGSWPAFWLMTDYMAGYSATGGKTPSDELDIIEAYGGEGVKEPNSPDSYRITPHCWNQGPEETALKTQAFEALHNPCTMPAVGIPSGWCEAFHTYGCKVAENETIYYCDNIEVGRHETFPLSKTQPLFFMINLATTSSWPTDLSRYDGRIDMYVDFVRVYAGKK